MYGPSGHVWSGEVMYSLYGHVWPWVVIYGQIRLCMAMNGHAWWCMVICGYVWPGMVFCGHVCSSLFMFGHVWSGHAWSIWSCMIMVWSCICIVIVIYNGWESMVFYNQIWSCIIIIIFYFELLAHKIEKQGCILFSYCTASQWWGWPPPHSDRGSSFLFWPLATLTSIEASNPP